MFSLTILFARNSAKQIQSQTGAKVMFIEVVNENAEFLEQRYADAAAFNPDYAGQCASASVRFLFSVY